MMFDELVKLSEYPDVNDYFLEVDTTYVGNRLAYYIPRIGFVGDFDKNSACQFVSDIDQAIRKACDDILQRYSPLSGKEVQQDA